VRQRVETNYSIPTVKGEKGKGKIKREEMKAKAENI